jgi:hypothetical protein
MSVMTARQGALVATVALVSGLACTGPEAPMPREPDLKVHPQPACTLSCNGFDLQLPALDESMAPAWASFQIAQLNQEALAPLGAEERRSLFETCVIPAMLGAM